MALRSAWTWPIQQVKDGAKAPAFVAIASSESADTQESLKEEKDDQNDRTPSTRLSKLATALRLGSVYLLLQEIGGAQHIEEKKIAIIASLRSASLVSILHIVPTSASIILIIFNLKGYYIGSELQGPIGEDGLRFLGLQFAAKMLELLAMASLSVILFAILRAQLIWYSLPFGTLTAGFDFTNLSLLWSKEFFATCRSTHFSSPKIKAFLIGTIVTFTMLGATIGPSAATASRPVLQAWPAGGTEFWLNATSQDLWPLALNNMELSGLPCDSSTSHSCFSLNYNVLADGQLSLWPTTSFGSADNNSLPNVIPEKALIAGRHSMRTMATRFRGPFIYHPELTIATVPSAAISDALSQISRYWFMANQHQCLAGNAGYCFYQDIVHTIVTTQPIIYVQCAASSINATVQFPRLDQGSGNYPLISFTNTTIGSQPWFDLATGNGTNPSLSWLNLPEEDFGRTSIGAVVALPGTYSPEIPGQVLACTVDARWANATTTISFLGGPMITSGEPDNWFQGGQSALNSSGLPLWPQVKIAPAWADAINPVIAQPSTSVFAMLCNSVGRLNSIPIAELSLNAVEAVLAVMVTDGLSRTSSDATILGSLKGIHDSYPNEEWMAEFLPKRSVFGKGGSAFDYVYQLGDHSTKFEATSTVLGYGYGITTATVLSTIVLLIYSLIAVIYVIYSIIFTKTTSSSWESIMEMVALAANSQPSNALHNSGAGIGSLTTLKQEVAIRVIDDRLQMAFKDITSENRVESNVKYG